MKAVTIYSTSKCNIRCKHCGVGLDQENPRKQQTTEELKKIITEIAKGGAQSITILGGEATIYRNDLSEILDHAYKVGINISINTNLTSFKAVEDLINKPALRSLIVSLDGASAETHNANRGKGTFEKTIENLKKITSSPRVINGSLFIEIAFVMTGLNYHETSSMLYLAVNTGATHLNVKNVKLLGRANSFLELLELSKRKLISTYATLIFNWMLLDKKIELEVFIPPAFAEFLNKKYQFDFPTTYHPACGGANRYSYVDLYGNHLPCPAMSFEEKPLTGFKQKSPELNLLKNSIEETFETNLFKEFEENRNKRIYKDKLFPCKFCKYNTQCQQCVANIIGGAEKDSVDICGAIFEHGNEYLPNIREEIWIHYNGKQKEENQNFINP